MGVSALRIAACAGVLACGLMLGCSTGGLASADPEGGGQIRGDTEFSKGVNNDRPSLNRIIHRILSEHRKHARNESRTAPPAKVGSKPDSASVTSESTATTSAGPGAEPAPELVPDERETSGQDTPSASDGSDHEDNTVVSSTAEEATKKPSASLDYPFPFYLLEGGRGGGDWWSAQTIVSRLGKAIPPCLATTRTPDPEPEPEPAPAPAFRGPAPAAPAPEPVLDASGGIVGGGGGGGSDYRGTGFGAAPVLSAPVVAIPVPAPASARFPAFPPAPAAEPRVGSGAARGVSAEPAVTASAVRQAGGPQESRSSTITSMSEQAPRRGYTDYLRSPRLPQLAGAALPGVAGILLMTFAGGVVGYRQASAGRMIRASAAARYLP